MRRFDEESKKRLGEPAGCAERSTAPALRIVLPLRTITPVLGGGVKPWQPDVHDSVRVPAIRGHLRWWWRALCPAEWDAERLFREETALWGGVTEKEAVRSRVEISVGLLKCGSVRRSSELSNALRYATFPLDLSPGAKFMSDVEFEMRIKVREANNHDLLRVMRALWLWIHLGGLGARTRRGFGALALMDEPRFPDGIPTDTELSQVFCLRDTAAFKGYLHRSMKRGVRRSLDWSLAGTAHDASRASTAHELLIKTLLAFRQGRGTGRSNRNKSNWPDSKALRALRWPTSKSIPCGIPRAVFGLPLKFEFRHKDSDIPANSIIFPARGHVICGKGSLSLPSGDEELRRFGSPLLLALVTTTDGVVPIMLLLAGEYVDDLRLEWSDGTSAPRSVRYFASDGALDPIHSYLARSGGNAIEAFKDWAVSQRDNAGRKKWTIL